MKLKNGSHRNVYFRAVKNSRHKTICTAIVDEVEKRISYRDVGIYYYVMTRGEGWQLHMRDLANRKMESKGLIVASLRRLRHFGWCRLVQVRKGGVIVAYRYDFYDEPLKEPQREVVIEHYSERGKLIKAEQKKFGTRRWNDKGESPHIEKPVCGPHTTFPHSGKPVCGNVVASTRENNSLQVTKNGAIGYNTSISRSLSFSFQEKERKEEKKIEMSRLSRGTTLLDENVVIELDAVGLANAWWEQIAARVFVHERGFAARALGRNELVQIGEQLRALGPEELARRYQHYHRMKDAKIIESGYNMWNFLNNLDRLGVEVRKVASALGARPATTKDAGVDVDDALLRKFNANFAA